MKGNYTDLLPEEILELKKSLKLFLWLSLAGDCVGAFMFIFSYLYIFSGNIIGNLICIVLSLIFPVVFHGIQILMILDLKSGKKEIIAGLIQKKLMVYSDGGIYYYYFKVNGKRISVDEKSYNEFEPGEEVAVEKTKYLKVMLNIKSLSDYKISPVLINGKLVNAKVMREEFDADKMTDC